MKKIIDSAKIQRRCGKIDDGKPKVRVSLTPTQGFNPRIPPCNVPRGFVHA